jgi:hypothetical protein
MNVAAFGEGKSSPDAVPQPFISEPEHAFLKLTLLFDEVAIVFFK